MSRAIRQLFLGVCTFKAEGIGRVDMCSDEIGVDIILLTIIKQLFNPAIHCRSGTTNLQRWVNCFDGPNCTRIKLEVIFLCSSPESSQIGFIPHLKKPFAYLGNAVPVDPVAHYFANECSPLAVILWRCDIAPITKNRLAAGSERTRHKT